jgi:hypothetical protein
MNFLKKLNLFSHKINYPKENYELSHNSDSAGLYADQPEENDELSYTSDIADLYTDQPEENDDIKSYAIEPTNLSMHYVDPEPYDNNSDAKLPIHDNSPEVKSNKAHIMDRYLTHNAQITFLKNVYRRHTLLKNKNHLIYSTSKVNLSDILNINVPYDGHFLSSIFLLIKLPKYDAENNIIQYVKDINNTIINRVKFYIDDKLYCDINSDILYIQKHYSTKCDVINLPIFDTKKNKVILPILCLKDSVFNLIIELDDKNNCTINEQPISNISIQVYAKYYDADEDERRRFFLLCHEYLINTFNYKIIDFPHPNKNDILALNEFCNIYKFCEPVYKIIFEYIIPEYVDVSNELKFNSCYKFLSDEFSQFDGLSQGPAISDIHFAFRFPKKNTFFNYASISDHTHIYDSSELVTSGDKNYLTKISQLPYENYIKDIYTNSFAILPMEWQPSGTHNFSDTMIINNKINTKKMLEHGLDCKLVIMYNQYNAISIVDHKYNVLR